MPIFKGTETKNPVRINIGGTTELQKVYVGETLVWEKIYWIKIFEFQTNSSVATTFTPQLYFFRFYSIPLQWDLGDGTITYGSTISHTYADATVKTVQVYFPVNYVLLDYYYHSLVFDGDSIYGTLDLTWYSTYWRKKTVGTTPMAFFNLSNNPDLEYVNFPTSELHPDVGTQNITIINCPKLIELDFSFLIRITGNLNIYNNATLETLTFSDSSSFVGSVGFFRIYNNPELTYLDVSMFTNFPSTSYINIYGNTKLATLILPSTVTGTYRDLFIYGNTALQSLDISAFNSFTTSGYIYVYSQPNLTTLVFPSTYTGNIYYLQMYNLGLSGTVDLSWFTKLGTNSLIEFYNCSGVTAITFPSVFSAGTVQRIRISGNSLSGTLDLTMFKDLSASGTIRFDSNSNVTGASFNSTITGTLVNLTCNGCNLTGTLDLTMFTSLTAAFIFNLYSNPLLENISLPASSNGRCTTFAAYGCNLGYIDFTVIPNLTSKNSVSITLQNNGMTTTEVNHILVDLDSISVSGYTTRSINLGGTNAAPDSSSGGYNGTAAKSSLQSKGFSVTTN
jgi:hypothetical protein